MKDWTTMSKEEKIRESSKIAMEKGIYERTKNYYKLAMTDESCFQAIEIPLKHPDWEPYRLEEVMIYMATEI